VDAEVDVFDVLANHGHGHVAELDLCGHQYSVCATMIGKMRSSSVSS
jgi:hypothetical protein